MIPYPSPFLHFEEWFRDAVADDPQPEAVSLATATPDGRPSNRMVLVRRWSERGIEVYTDLGSQKGGELLANPQAAVTWHWKPLGRQVRAEGAIARLPDEVVDDYWLLRPRASRISAIASHQSEEIENREALLARRHEIGAVFDDDPTPPRPEWWGGFLLIPLRFEFWQHDSARFHDRLEYRRSGPAQPWTSRVLQP